MFFIFTFITHACAMEMGSAKDPFLEEIFHYKNTLQSGENPSYTDEFKRNIQMFHEQTLNMHDLLYEQENNTNYHEEFQEECLRIKQENGTILEEQYQEVLETIKPVFSTPIKQGKNKYYFPKTGLLPQGTPRRARNLTLVFEGKMPVYIDSSTPEKKETPYHMHHLTQQNEGEDVILLSREVHTKGTAVLHSYKGTSRINRSSFSQEKHRAIQVHFLSKVEQAYQKRHLGTDSSSYFRYRSLSSSPRAIKTLKVKRRKEFIKEHGVTRKLDFTGANL